MKPDAMSRGDPIGDVPADRPMRRPRGRSRVLFPGGPSHRRISATFIDTNVPGMPRMARLADKYAIVRSVAHEQSAHPAAAYWMMSGASIARPAPDASFLSRSRPPSSGLEPWPRCSGRPCRRCRRS